MFQVGEQVLYGVHGVCTVATYESRRIDRKNVTYLVLESADQCGSKYFVPVQNPVAMGKLKPILSGEELTTLLLSDAVRTDVWIQDENVRKQAYRDLLSRGDRKSILQMVYSIYRHKDRMASMGRKSHLCDDNFLRDAEKLIISEISVTLGMNPEQARAFLREKLRPIA